MMDENKNENQKQGQKKSHRKETEKASLITLADEQWEYCKQYFDFSCAYCRKKVKVLCRDHVIPLSSGGTLSADNVIPSCASCNSSKSNRKFIQWYRATPFYSYQSETKILDYLSLMKEEGGTVNKSK